MTGYGNIVILTGAGISVESGIMTFRAEDGLWAGHRVEDVATPEAFMRDPEQVQDFYNTRRSHLKTVEPNSAHLALAELEREWPGKVTLITQNIDDLHERAGSHHLIHMHGELKKVRCLMTDTVYPWDRDVTTEERCECCNEFGTLRPHIVWFGEMPFGMDRIERALSEASLFIAIGTSGNVYPAAGFVDVAASHGAHTVEINLEPSAVESFFDEKVYGLATEQVPAYVKKILDGIH